MSPSAERPGWQSFSDVRFVLAYLLVLFIGTALTQAPIPVVSRWGLPLCATLPALPVLYRRYAAIDLPGALREMLLAALWMSAGMLCSFGWLSPTGYASDGTLTGLVPVIQGEAYVAEMHHWIATGEGPEGDPARFIPIHLQHMLLVMGASLCTAGSVGFLFGAVQMGYMNAYVYATAALADSTGVALLLLLLTWHTWSVVRVVSFITLATALGFPLYARVVLPGNAIPWPTIARFVGAGLLLEALDIGLKTALAEPTRLWIQHLTGLGL